jgi:hypothetical protein
MHTWDWYLNQAYKTAITQPFSSVGLMNGRLYADLLADLKREGWDSQVTTLQNIEHERENSGQKRVIPLPVSSPGIRPARKRSTAGANISAITQKRI